MTYTLVITGHEGAQQTALTDYRDDDATIADVRHMVSADQPRIAIGAGAGAAVRWLGAWAWRDGEAIWTSGVGPDGGASPG
jgi:hypothetical protein